MKRGENTGRLQKLMHRECYTGFRKVPCLIAATERLISYRHSSLEEEAPFSSVQAFQDNKVKLLEISSLQVPPDEIKVTKAHLQVISSEGKTLWVLDNIVLKCSKLGRGGERLVTARNLPYRLMEVRKILWVGPNPGFVKRGGAKTFQM